VSKIFEVTNGLVRRGYSDNEIKKIVGRNFLGLCKRVFGE
jgi:microsomal dipeptidase-like Zn-dependent dipeptidase